MRVMAMLMASEKPRSSALPDDGEPEIRPVMAVNDVGDAFPPAMREGEVQRRATKNRNPGEVR
jgi:hypothetical protein